MGITTKNKTHIPKGYPRLAPPPPHVCLNKRIEAIRTLRSQNQRYLYNFKQNFLISLSAFLYNRIAELFYYSYRKKSFTIHPQAQKLIEDPQGQFIVAFWHNRLFYMPFSTRQNILRKGHDILAMVSPSKDGELTTRIVANWGAYVTRGSSSRKGANALREILRYVKLHFHPLIIPDGPRGPCHEVKEGIVLLARLSGLPVLPLCYAAKKKWTFGKSWDHFSIPKPFSPIAIEYGEPIFISKDMDIEAGRLLIQEKMKDQSSRLEKLFYSS